MQGKVEICGVNTARLPVLKNEEMMALLRRTKEGDRAAREQLICGNLRLVLSVIQRFLGRGENVDDLFQVGCIGLIKAIDNFDIRQNVRFSTYGVPMIVGEIRRYLRDNSAIRVSPKGHSPLDEVFMAPPHGTAAGGRGRSHTSRFRAAAPCPHPGSAPVRCPAACGRARRARPW